MSTQAGGAGPQYVQVARALRGRIETGEYGVGQFLPTETELKQQYGISRHTAREALRILSDLRLIERRRGSGSQVIAAAPQRPYVHSMHSLDELFQYASDTRFEVASVGLERPDPDEFGKVAGVDLRVPWLIVRGTRFEAGSDTAICHSTVLIASRYAEVADALKAGTGAIYRRIEDRFDVEVAEVLQTIGVEPLSSAAATVLGAATGGLGVRVQRIYRSAAGDTILLSVNHHPADKFSYTMRLARQVTGR